MVHTESIFTDRIFDMMAEYRCTMKDALIWDFESFEFDIRGMDEDLFKSEFMFYLYKNGIDCNSNLAQFYTDVALGNQNYTIKANRVK